MSKSHSGLKLLKSFREQCIKIIRKRQLDIFSVSLFNFKRQKRRGGKIDKTKLAVDKLECNCQQQEFKTHFKFRF